MSTPILFEDGLYAFLIASSDLTTLLGTSRCDQTSGVFANLAPGEATVPYIVYQQIHQEEEYTLEGVNRSQESRYRFSCYGNPAKQAKMLAATLKQVLDDYVGTWTNGIIVQGTFLITVNDTFEPVPHGTIFARHVDFRFMWVDPS